MFLYLPYGDDAPREGRYPWMNMLLIGVNVLLFVNLGLRPDYEQIVLKWGFTPAEPSAATVFSSIFLHADWLHLLGNMWFLYLFGDNVEARCGPLKYLLAYLLAHAVPAQGLEIAVNVAGRPWSGASGQDVVDEPVEAKHS